MVADVDDTGSTRFAGAGVADRAHIETVVAFDPDSGGGGAPVPAGCFVLGADRADAGVVITDWAVRDVADHDLAHSVTAMSVEVSPSKIAWTPSPRHE